MEPVQIAFSITLMIVGSFWGYFLNNTLEKRRLPKISAARRKAITGTWKGTFYQDKNDNRDSQNIAVQLELDANRRRVTGLMQMTDDEDFEFLIEGAFYHDKYLRLNYTAAGCSCHAIDFGTLFLVVDAYPKKILGKLSGYGSITDNLISGKIQVNRRITSE